MSRRVLIIDDDATLLRTTRLILEGEGYEVSTVASPLGVSKAVADFEPDLILLDVNMPALSGEGLAEILGRNDRFSKIPILLHSSNDADSLRATVRRVGVAGWISKGDLGELRDKVRAHLSPSPASR